MRNTFPSVESACEGISVPPWELGLEPSSLLHVPGSHTKSLLMELSNPRIVWVGRDFLSAIQPNPLQWAGTSSAESGFSDPPPAIAQIHLSLTKSRNHSCGKHWADRSWTHLSILFLQPLIWKTEVQLSGKILDVFQKKEKSLLLSERILEWPVSGSSVHLHNVGCPFLLILLHQENISGVQLQKEVTTPWVIKPALVLGSARGTLTSPCPLIIILSRRTKIRNLRGAAMTVLQLSHVPEITAGEGKSLASKYCYRQGMKNQGPFRAQALSLWNAPGVFQGVPHRLGEALRDWCWIWCK